jgi:hypothetical protein
VADTVDISGHVQAVEEGLAHRARMPAKAREVAQGEAAVGVGKGGVEHARHGQHEEQQQEGQHQRPGHPWAGTAPRHPGGLQGPRRGRLLARGPARGSRRARSTQQRAGLLGQCACASA